MANPLLQTIEALAKEKGIEADQIIAAIEDAVLTASRKYYKTNENLKTRFNTDTGQVDLFAIKHIVAGSDQRRHRDLAHRKPRPSTATKPKWTWRSSSRSAPTCSGASRRRRPSR